MPQERRTNPEERLAAIASLSGTPASQAEFLRRLLDAVAVPDAICGGGIWMLRDERSLECCAAEGDDYRAWITNGGLNHGMAALRHESLTTGERRLIPCETGAPAGRQPPRFAGSMLVHWPLQGSAGANLIELVFDAAADEASRRDVLQLLQRAEPYCTAFLDMGSTAEAPPAADRGDWEAFVLGLHRTLHLSEMCFTIANDGRRLVGCDRLCVLVDDGARLRLAGVSGVDLPDRRSAAVRSIEAAGTVVMRAGVPLTYTEASAGSDGDPSDPIAAYADACQVRTALLVPLLPADGEPSQRPVGALIAEWFTRANPALFEPQLERLSRHASIGLRNAVRHSDVAWAEALLPVHWVRRLWLGGRGPWTAAVLGAVAVVTAALILVPAPLVVSARGELQPVVRQHVYAPLDGVVEQVLVQADDDVAAEATLLTMSNPALDLEVQRVTGAIDTWTKKLASIGIRRLDDGGRRDDAGAAERMSGEEGEIREELGSLRQQLALLEKKRALLGVKSPIAGRIVTWNVREDLAQRPVREGERLLTVADVHSGWELELRLDERDAGHVADAMSAAPGGLEVEFLLASRADETHRARLERLANAVYWDRDGHGERVSAPATAVVTGADFGAERPGTSVVARVECGWRSLGYVWFHDLYEAVVRLLWY